MSDIKRDEPAKRVARNVWGWFVICVWIVGVPNVLKYAYFGAKDALRATTCITASYNCTTEEPAPEKKHP